MYHHNGDRPLDNNVRLQLPADGRPIANVPVRAEGNLYYDTISDIVYLSDGIAWIPFGGFGATVDLQKAYENGVTTGNLGLIEDPSGRPLFVISPTEGLQTFQNQLGSGTDIIPVAGLFDMATFFIEDQPNRLILDPSIATDVILPPIATDPNTGYPGTISVGVGYSTTISNQAAPGGSDLTVRPTAPDTPDPVVTIPPGFTATIQAVDNGATFGWVIVMFASGSTGSSSIVDLQKAYENGVITGNLGTITDPSGRRLFDLSPTTGLKTFQNELGFGTNVVPVAGIFTMETFFLEDQPNRLILDPSIATDVILPPIAADPNVGYPGTHSVGIGYSTTISNQAALGGSDLTVRPTAPDTPDPVVRIPPEYTATVQAVDLGGGLFGWVVVMFASGSSGFDSIVDLQKAYENGTVTGNLGRITDPSGRQLFDLAPTTGLKTFQNELGFGTNIIDVAGLFTMETFFLEDQPNRLFLNPTLATDVILPPIAADPNVGYPGTHSVGIGYSVTISNQATAGGDNITVRPTAPDTPDPVVVIPPEYGAIIQAVDLGGGLFGWVVALFAPGSGGGGPVVPTTLQDAYDGTTLAGTQPAIRYDSVGIYGPITIRQPLAGDTVNELMVFEDTTGATTDYLSITQQGLFGRNAVGTGNNVVSYGGTDSLASTNMLIIGSNTLTGVVNYGGIIGTANTLDAGDYRLTIGTANNIATGNYKVAIGDSNTIGASNYKFIFGTNNDLGNTLDYGYFFGNTLTTTAATDHIFFVGEQNITTTDGRFKYSIGGGNAINNTGATGGPNVSGCGGALGTNCITTGSGGHHYVFGDFNNTSQTGGQVGSHKYLFGLSNTASGNSHSYIFGDQNVVSGSGEFHYVFGESNVANSVGDHVYFFGQNLITTLNTAVSNTIALGRALDASADNTIILKTTPSGANLSSGGTLIPNPTDRLYVQTTNGTVLNNSNSPPWFPGVSPWLEHHQFGAVIGTGANIILVATTRVTFGANQAVGVEFFITATTATGLVDMATVYAKYSTAGTFGVATIVSLSETTSTYSASANGTSGINLDVTNNAPAAAALRIHCTVKLQRMQYA